MTKLVVATKEDALALSTLLKRVLPAGQASVVVAGSASSTIAVANTLARAHRTLVVVDGDSSPMHTALGVRSELEMLKRDPDTQIVVIEPSLLARLPELETLDPDDLRRHHPIREILDALERERTGV